MADIQDDTGLVDSLKNLFQDSPAVVAPRPTSMAQIKVLARRHTRAAIKVLAGIISPG